MLFGRIFRIDFCHFLVSDCLTTYGGYGFGSFLVPNCLICNGLRHKKGPWVAKMAKVEQRAKNALGLWVSSGFLLHPHGIRLILRWGDQADQEDFDHHARGQCTGSLQGQIGLQKPTIELSAPVPAQLT